MMKRLLSSSLVLAAIVAVSLSADADERRRRRPPPEAVAACRDRADGDACSVTLHDRTIDGTCRAAPDGGDEPLACMPAHPPGPPPEAVDACSGRAAGDACTVKLGDDERTGTCRTGPDGNGPLACAPEGGHRHPRQP